MFGAFSPTFTIYPLSSCWAFASEQVMTSFIVQLQSCNHSVRHVVSQAALELGALYEGDRLAAEVYLLGQQLEDSNRHILIADVGQPADKMPVFGWRHHD